MAEKEKYPVTLAVRELIKNNINFTAHVYAYQEKGGTAVSSRELKVDEHSVIKTLILETDEKKPLIVLMHGDMQVSTKQLARELKVKSVAPCSPETAERHSGYQVGGTSPFGTRKPMPVYVEKTIVELEKILINGGKRGFLVELNPRDLVRVLKPSLVSVAVDPKV